MNHKNNKGPSIKRKSLRNYSKKMDGRLRRHPRKFALPKAFQLNSSRSVGFFNAHPLNQASLFRGFALKKPVTFVTGFVARPGFEPGTSGL